MKICLKPGLNKIVTNIAESRGVDSAVDYIMAEKKREAEKYRELAKPRFCRKYIYIYNVFYRRRFITFADNSQGLNLQPITARIRSYKKCLTSE